MKPKLLLLLMILSVGCNLPFGGWGDQPNNVEVIVPEAESEMYFPSSPNWMLSPGGDKIFYYSLDSQKSFLLNLATGEKSEIEYCFNWLNNTSLLCGESAISVIFITDRISKVPITKIDIAEVDLTAVLRNAREIYHIERWHDFLVLNPQLDKNYLVDVKGGNVEPVLKGYSYVTIPMFPEQGYHDKIYSPNGTYYYKVEVRNAHILAIYDAVTDTKLVEVSGDNIELGGWAADNSGVYFQIYHHELLNPQVISRREAINKLKAPQ